MTAAFAFLLTAATLIVPPVLQDSVFLNIPYDAAFECLYLAYIAGITALNLIPRTTLEIPETTRRLDRIQAFGMIVAPRFTTCHG